jgi:hypothetical protein
LASIASYFRRSVEHNQLKGSDELLARLSLGKICARTGVERGSNFRRGPMTSEQDNTSKRTVLLDRGDLGNELPPALAAFDYEQREVGLMELIRFDLAQARF